MDTIELILNQPIWLNSHIKLGKNQAMFYTWCKAGIQWLSDIVHNSQKLYLNQSELEQKFQIKIAFTDYYGLLKSIPREWTTKLGTIGTENDDEDAEDYKWIDRILSSAKPTKMVYTFQ